MRSALFLLLLGPGWRLRSHHRSPGQPVSVSQCDSAAAHQGWAFGDSAEGGALT